MDPNWRRMTDSVLNLTLEIMYLLTGEDYTVVKKTNGKQMAPTNLSQGSDGWSRTQSIVTAPSAISPSHGENDRKVLELANRIIHFLTGEVWQYLLGHKDLVNGLMARETYSTETSEETTTTWKELEPNSTTSTLSDHTNNSFVKMKNEQGSLNDNDCQANSDTLEHTTYTATHFKLEAIPYEEGHMFDAKISSSSNHLENSSTIIKEEFALSTDGNADFYETSYDNVVSFSDNPTMNPNQKTVNNNPECLGTAPDFDNSLALVETEMTLMTESAHKVSFSDTLLATTTPQEGCVQSKPFTCSKCNKRFSSQISLFRHKRIHVGLERKGGRCTKVKFESDHAASNCCISKIPLWTGGGRQLGTVAKNGGFQSSNHKTSSCDYVKQNMQDAGGKQSRTNHKNTSSGISNQQTRSSKFLDLVDQGKFKKSSGVECGITFPLKSHLDAHQKNRPHKSQFSCSDCGKYFTSNSHLVVHQRVHTGERPFGCSGCPKRFATKSTLVIHQRVHTREKPYSCTECQKCFPCNSQLVIHQRTHTGEKPYSCLECGKGFISNSDLLRHRRVHTGERPFRCTECAKCFSQKSHLREHHKTHRR